MTSVIGFMTSTLFCTRCSDDSSDAIEEWECDGEIQCPWLSPHDEANCSQQCSSSLSLLESSACCSVYTISPDYLKCDGYVQYPWLSPHDEANCSQQCSSSCFSFSCCPWSSFPCDCNKPQNMTCEGSGRVCYREFGKLLVLFYFCKRHND